MLKSKELYDRIEELRIQRGMSVAKLNNLAGISHNTLSSWKQRGTMPKLDVLESLCYALDVPLSLLLYDVDADKLSGEETEVLACWKKLDASQKRAVLLTMKSMIKK